METQRGKGAVVPLIAEETGTIGRGSALSPLAIARLYSLTFQEFTTPPEGCILCRGPAIV